MDPTAPRGLTIALRVGPAPAALDFYRRVLLRGPDYSPHDDFHEWQISPGAWLQLVTDTPSPQPSPSRLRFEVADLASTVARLRDEAIVVSDPTTLPGVVTFTDFADPWGNPLGAYQDLSPGAPPPVPGGSARDPGLFR
jgi:catechol 2,3-dioxygenase-like lactoylglutathione lyase family enzyme